VQDFFSKIRDKVITLGWSPNRSYGFTRKLKVKNKEINSLELKFLLLNVESTDKHR